MADLIRAHRRQISSRWRKLDAGQTALIVLAHLRNDERVADLAGGNAVSASTVRRWVLEVLGLLAARSPRLDRALAKVAKDSGCVVLLDGTLMCTRRRSGRANRKSYSGKHKAHGLLFLALTDAKGRLLWISSARRGACSEIMAARYEKLCARLRELELAAVADLGFVGLDEGTEEQPAVITGVQGERRQAPVVTEGGREPAGQQPAGAGRARLREPEDLPDPDQGAHASAARDRADASPAGADAPPGGSVTGDLPAMITVMNCASTPTAHHTRTVDLYESR
ncbi:hypothetical protein SGFS_008270 [Streptomyces graminofaciens]|uniref:Transposase n=1 Tax=Streptomyces graminofaciens TaxID=68212 RepID=A0ABM7F1B3_9ACTN|nr:hypothetical protein SGFS_008270 [Streptomyces graminofaciens]